MVHMQLKLFKEKKVYYSICMSKKICFLFTVLTLALSSLFASPITDFHFVGLKKTKESAAKEPLEKFIGKEADEKTLHQIETTLQQVALYSSIEIEKVESEEGTEITITVKEKISFLVFPMAMITSGSIMGGVFMLDSNFLGLKHLVILGGFASRTEIRGIWMYQTPTKGYFPGFSIFGSAGWKEQVYKNLEDEDVINYTMVSTNCGLKITENLFKYIDVSMSANFGFKNFSDDEKNPMTSNRFVELKPEINASYTDWNGVFLSVKSASFTYGGVIQTNHDVWHTFSPRMVFQQPIFVDSLRIISNGSGFYGIDVPYSALANNASLGVNILPSKFGTSSGFGVSAGLEFCPLKTKIGNFSVYSSYQFVRTRDLDDEYKNEQGVVAGIQMYLKQLAVPAMSVGLLYNITHNRFGGYFTLGMSF